MNESCNRIIHCDEVDLGDIFWDVMHVNNLH